MLKERKIDTKEEVRAKGEMKETRRRLGQRNRAEIEHRSQGTGGKEAQGEAASCRPGEAGISFQSGVCTAAVEGPDFLPLKPFLHFHYIRSLSEQTK